MELHTLTAMSRSRENVKLFYTSPTAKIELRMDGAFFSERIIQCLDELCVEYSISVPYERCTTTIKCYFEEQKQWRQLRKGAK